jgi:hypothetical protein
MDDYAGFTEDECMDALLVHCATNGHRQALDEWFRIP